MSDENKFHMYGISWRESEPTRYYKDGERVYIRKQVRYKRLRVAIRLLFNGNLRRRLIRYQKARSEYLWRGSYALTSFVNRELSIEEMKEIYKMGGLL